MTHPYLILFLVLFYSSFSYQNDRNLMYIPTSGNSWIMQGNKYIDSDMITKNGIQNWQNKTHVVRTFFYSEKAQSFMVGIRAKVLSGNSQVIIKFQDQSKLINLSTTELNDYSVGQFEVQEKGYYYIDIEPISKESSTFAEVESIILSNLDADATKLIKDDFYFGRRGPSVHLRFDPPKEVENVEWFYSEIYIPKNEDVIGSYFMANGFGEGYFGIQVNSENERRILFSIWSPFKTDRPEEVPDEYKIKLLKKSEGVTTGKFGDEGSGGQSYKVYNWKAETNYGFLTGAKPDGNGNTIYTSYFYAPELNKWSLIAQFSRPKTSTYLTRLYSFLENFIPFQGVFERKGLFQNQWIFGNGEWHEINTATFTADATARKKARLDYSGGVSGKAFYLQNCGFTNNWTKMQSVFVREKSSRKPIIDFSLLD